MAEPIKFVPKSNPETTAREELDELVETLHRSGTLRVLTGLFGRFSDVSELAVKRLNEPGGKHIVANLSIAATALAELDADGFKRMAVGLAKGIEAAQAEARGDRPPSTFKLFRLLHDSDTRRGIYALLVMLGTLGRHLRPDRKPSTAIVPAGAS